MQLRTAKKKAKRAQLRNFVMPMLIALSVFSTGCIRTILIPTSCVVLDTPEYPTGVTWELCEESKPCLSLVNAKKLALYLAEVKRYHDHIEQVCQDD